MPKLWTEGSRVETNLPKLISTNKGVCITEAQRIIDLKKFADPKYISFADLVFAKGGVRSRSQFKISFLCLNIIKASIFPL